MMISSLSASATALPANNTATLNFGVFISQAQFDFSGFIPPLELGIRTINDNQTVLKGLNGMNYFIQYEHTNAMVS